MAPKVLFLGFQACPRRRERGCRGGSADLVPTSRPLRSEQALGSVVPSPYPPPRLAAHINTRGLLIQAEVMSKTYLVSFGIVNQAAALALCRPWLLFFLLEGTPARRSFAPDVVRDPLRQLSGAAPDATTNKPGRTRRGTYRIFPRGTRTTQPRSQSIACWPFLSRDSHLHLPNSSFR